jgi:hypothetical protein
MLPGTFIGGPRDKMRRYMGAMALLRKYGNRYLGFYKTLRLGRQWVHEMGSYSPKQQRLIDPE